MKVLRPGTLGEARALIARPGHVAVGGGTVLQLGWASGATPPEALVDLSRLGLGDIAASADGGLTIGAAATLADIENDPQLSDTAPLLARAVRDIGAPGIRRLATLGGQIGWGAGCLLPALLALDARVFAAGSTDPVDMPLADWLAAPDGLVLSVTVPPQAPDATWTWRKIGLRAAFTPSVIAVAGLRSEASAALGAGGGPVPPRRLPVSEAAVAEGPEALRLALEAEIEAPDCIHRTGRYRARVAAAALTRGLFGTPRAPAAETSLKVPAAEPPPEGLRSLEGGPGGPEWHPRPDGRAKITGQAGYLTDARAPDMLVGRILRAGRPHARILSLDTSRAETLPGVAAVVTHADVPGLNAFGIMWQDQPALCHDVIRYEGDPVAAVAAVDEATAETALQAIEVVYEDLPVIASPAEALAEDATRLHQGGNLAAGFDLERGDVEAGFGAAAHIVEATYVTPRQMHVFLETEGGWCAPGDDGTLTVAVGGQHGGRDREQLARILDMPEERLHVITSPTGGGFGGKDELTVQPALALLALKAGRPVRLHLSRAESVLAGVKRNPMTIRMKTGCDADGRLLAQEVELVADCGAYASLSPAVAETALEHALGPYLAPALKTSGRLAYTNNGVGGAFRGFGANQMTFAIECQLDRLAALTGLDPVEIRRRNLRRPGMPGLMGHKVAGSERLAEMLAAAAASPLWSARAGPDGDPEGTGMALNFQGNGLGSLPQDDGEGELRLAADGAIEIASGLDEMGQGLATALQAVGAARLGCARSDIRPVYGDTQAAPDSGSTSASRGTFAAWSIARGAAPGFAEKVLALAADLTGVEATSLRLVPGGVAVAGTNSDAPIARFADLARHAGTALPRQKTAFAFPKTDYTDGNARFIHCYGATLARVAVDPVTGEVRLRALEMHTAAGPVIDLAAYLGQIEGGLIQGLGLTLTEDTLFREGRVLTTNLDAYMVPSIRDVAPSLRVTALEDLDADDPWGPRGVGELGIGAVTPAIANAVAAAIGGWPVAAPFSPEAILELATGSAAA
ncbi:MAG: molybdopterin-dependent oxidoreductase [Paracoccaceae bacterium]|nr:molybdopterin-dependent oxidoreductase [Paracoccaceae bacterium]